MPGKPDGAWRHVQVRDERHDLRRQEPMYAVRDDFLANVDQLTKNSTNEFGFNNTVHVPRQA